MIKNKLITWLGLSISTIAIIFSPLEASARSISKHFLPTSSLAAPVKFWHDIYSAYDRNQVVIHDVKDLGLIYEVLDLSDISKLGNPFESFPPAVRQARLDRVQNVQNKIQAALLQLHKNGKPTNYLERKIAQLTSKTPGGREKYKDLAGQLRSQTGMKDRFRVGVSLSGRYMDRIEQIFQEEGVPWELSRLVFVESMFDLRALSKVGASGIWQFMPGTAKLMGLSVDKIIDERNDPLAATRAAARLLKSNYKMLGTWPLAINAYNAGPGRLRQAVSSLGTTDIATIIYRFNHPGYGFASRNFVPEYYAALQVFEERKQHFGAVETADPINFHTIVTNKAVNLPKLASHTGVAIAEIWELNPGYASEIYQGRTLLPPGYALKVPPTKRETFIASIDRIGDNAVASNKR